MGALDIYKMATIAFTRKGDKGITEFGKGFLPKSDPAFAAVGDLDELNSCLSMLYATLAIRKKNAVALFWATVILFANGNSGLCTVAFLAMVYNIYLTMRYSPIMHDIKKMASINVHIMSHLYRADSNTIQLECLDVVEKSTMYLNSQLPKLTSFIIVRHNGAAASADHARTVARRAERSIVALRTDSMSPVVYELVNRMSSYLYVLSRYLDYIELNPDNRVSGKTPRL